MLETQIAIQTRMSGAITMTNALEFCQGKSILETKIGEEGTANWTVYSSKIKFRLQDRYFLILSNLPNDFPGEGGAKVYSQLSLVPRDDKGGRATAKRF